MIKKILLIVAALVVVFVVVTALQPGEYLVARSAAIAAPPSVVFAQVNDLHRWQSWSPWEKIDPAMKRTYEGPQAGPGAIYAWAGNNDVGEGRMTIGENRPNESVRFNLEFYKPMAGTATADFTFKPEGDRTAVTWSMTGKKNFISKAVCLFMSMDKMIGGEFEKGLADLKTVSETVTKK